MIQKALVLFLYCSLCSLLSAQEYTAENHHGWSIHVEHSDKEAQRETLSAAKTQLHKDLNKIETLVSAEMLKKLKTVPLWISFNSEPGAAYHPSEIWLRNNGRKAEMAKSIEIQNAQNYLDWVKFQPMIILHELTHGYHHQFLGYDNQEIMAAYQNAKAAGIYDKVAHVNGGKRKAYALTNEKEYFAELTEAYFEKNDFFPFTNEELKAHDPTGYALVHKLWN